MLYKILHKSKTWNFIFIDFRKRIITDNYIQLIPLKFFTLTPKGISHYGKEDVPVVRWLNLQFGTQAIGYIKRTRSRRYQIIGPDRKRYQIFLVYTRRERNQLKRWSRKN